mgnify:CR=1 FL=1
MSAIEFGVEYILSHFLLLIFFLIIKREKLVLPRIQ